MDTTPLRSPGAQTRTDSGKPKYRADAAPIDQHDPPQHDPKLSPAQTTLQQYEAYAALSPAVIDSPAPPSRVQSSPVPGAEAENSSSSESQLARGMRSTLARRSVAKVAAASNDAAAPPSSWDAPSAPLVESLAAAPTAPASSPAVATSATPRSLVAGGYVSFVSAVPSTEIEEPEPQPDESSTAEHAELPPVDSGRDALQAEISRLQAQLQMTRSSPSPPVAHRAVQSRMRTSPGATRSLQQAAWLSSPLSSSSSPICASPRTASARDRLREREQSLRSHISARAHFYCLMLLRALLVQFSLAKGSTLVALAMSLPHVREALCFVCDVLVASAEWSLHSSLFGLLPGSSFVRSVLSDPALEAEWMALPEWPQPRVLPWTAGPLRPAFVVASYLPFSSRFFELAPTDEEQQQQQEGVEGSEQQREPVEDGPLVSSLKRAGGIEPVVARRAAVAVRSPSSSASPVAAAADPIRDSSPPVAAAFSAAARSSSLLARLDAQQTLINLLQQDRAVLHACLRRLETQVRLMQQQQLLQQRSPSASPLSPAGVGLVGGLEADSSFPLASSSLASFIGMAASQRLQSLQEENVQLRGLSLAQQAQAEQQEREIREVRREFEALRASIKQWETQQPRESPAQPSASPEPAAAESQQQQQATSSP